MLCICYLCSSPIKVDFISYLTKSLVLSKSFNLKGSNVYINSDLCEEDREKEKELKNHLKEARRKNYTAYKKNWNLYVNGEQFSVEDFKQLNEVAESEVEEGEVADTSSAVDIVSSNNQLSSEHEHVEKTETSSTQKDLKAIQNIFKNTVDSKNRIDMFTGFVYFLFFGVSYEIFCIYLMIRTVD
ncbi:hypothetical protein HHI36_001550 [Cryptolaemus montrouzieri]|uniref:Uncharacterized protein n=1 Tax=Cryptolaemus montrouzieri TaxID=559131 RepID=A0ABD2P7T3_9CUCU